MSAVDLREAMADAQRVLLAIAQGESSDALRLPAAEAAQRLGQCGARLHQKPIHFSPAATPNTWRVGPADDVHDIPGNGLGLSAAWQALSGFRPACADLAGAGARNPVSIVSRAVRQTAVSWAEQIGRYELAAAFRRIHVADGRLHYSPAANAPQIVTEHVIPMSTDVHLPGASVDDSSSSDEVTSP